MEMHKVRTCVSSVLRRAFEGGHEQPEHEYLRSRSAEVETVRNRAKGGLALKGKSFVSALPRRSMKPRGKRNEPQFMNQYR